MSEPRVLPDQEPLRAAACEIFAWALAECSIAKAFTRSVQLETAPDGLQMLRIGRHAVELAGIRSVRVVAAGKAAWSMLDALLPLLPERLDVQGVLTAPMSPRELPVGFQFFPGGHPLPNAASFAAARAAIAMLQEIPASSLDSPETLCLFLVSGGASAMLELPLDPSISLEDTVEFHRALVHGGATISEINCVRKHFSAVKGGRLAALARHPVCVSILVSDVPHGHEDAIGSGPAIPDSTTVGECRDILAHYRLMERFPASVQAYFRAAELPETPKPAELAAQSFTLLDAGELAHAAVQRAEQLGFHAVIDNTCDDWDYRAAADYLLARVRALRRIYPRVCLISVGEVTVESNDHHLVSAGIGGRNQQFALYAATRLERADAPITLLSAGSDGIDGNSAAAGAVVDHNSAHSPRLRAAAYDALLQFSSTPFLESIGATIVTGPTGNNLRDLRLLISE